MEAIFAFIGRPFINFMKKMDTFGSFVIFQLALLPLMFKRPWRIKQIFEQIEVVDY